MNNNTHSSGYYSRELKDRCEALSVCVMFVRVGWNSSSNSLSHIEAPPIPVEIAIENYGFAFNSMPNYYLSIIAIVIHCQAALFLQWYFSKYRNGIRH